VLIKPDTLRRVSEDKKKRNLWSEDEMQRLFEAFKIYDKKDFKSISQYIGSRTVA